MQIFSYRMVVWSILISTVQLVLFLALHFVARALHTASKVYNINGHNCLLIIFIHYLLTFYLTKTKLKKKEMRKSRK